MIASNLRNDGGEQEQHSLDAAWLGRDELSGSRELRLSHPAKPIAFLVR